MPVGLCRALTLLSLVILKPPILTQEPKSSPFWPLRDLPNTALIIPLPAHTLSVAPLCPQGKVLVPSLAFEALPQSTPAHLNLPSMK